jgi:GNAT superfamily N-acetyltransferase
MPVYSVSCKWTSILDSNDFGEKIIDRSRDGEILVVERGGRLVAAGALEGGEISGLFVDPQFQRGGIGAALSNSWKTTP